MRVTRCVHVIENFRSVLAYEWAIVGFRHIKNIHIIVRNFPRSRKLIQRSTRVLYSTNNKFVSNLHFIIVKTVKTVKTILTLRCSRNKRAPSSSELGQLRVPIVTGVGDSWKMARMSLPCESRCCCCCAASWADKNTSSPVTPATEPTTPPALLRSPVTCHAARLAKIKDNHTPISLIVKLNVCSLRDTMQLYQKMHRYMKNRKRESALSRFKFAIK